ncbi:MAG TPA: DEAD/DEAH box helicase, partial [Candidatus Berkiella sp.]|nr:DEAD/DEAH box helicase [Candidatus Berkiella sp.]
LPPENESTLLTRGSRVLVPFGRQTLVGIVFGHSQESAFTYDQLKAIHQACDPVPLFPESLCTFIEKTAAYYHHPIGEVAFSGAPSLLREGKPCPSLPDEIAATTQASEITLNEQQQFALQAIHDAQQTFQPFLLEGVTGSGKTEVYLRAAQIAAQKKQQILILVPEISLTPQTQQRFIEKFGQAVICYHSRMTPKERFIAWLKVKEGHAVIVIGTRSSIFLPFTQLGLIVVDEEHDASFKQQEGFRYSARDMAIMRAKLLQCPVILGSATPAFETLFNAQSGKYQHLTLPLRATKVQLQT